MSVYKYSKMKNSIFIFTMLIVSSMISCSTDDNFNHQKEFENSKKVWLDFKESTNNSYKYTVSFGSWTGANWETTISVSNGVVIQRSFKYIDTGGVSDTIPEEELEWVENENEIGTHQNGAAPLTLDEVYDNAKNDWLVKRKNTQTYFETENNGMISTCGFNEENCMDDCFTGIHIKSIEAL